MEIRLKRSDFLGELIPMQGIVERKTTIPVLSHLLLTAREDRLDLAATDLEVSLTSSSEAEVKQEGGIAVQARKLIEIIRALAGEEVHLSQVEPRTLNIRAGSSRFRVHGLPAEDFPTLPRVMEASAAPAGGAPTVVEIPFSTFKRMVGKVLFAVSAEESRFQLNGALFRLKDGTCELVATDGHRLALIEGRLAASAGEDSVLVPRKALQELQRFEGEGALAYRRDEHHLSFRLGRRELICRILEGSFPDYERVIARDNDKSISFERQHLASAVQRAALMTGDRARAVRLQFAPGQLVISAVNADLGEAIEEVACEYSGPEFRLGLNPDYLSDFLSAVESERGRLELKDENSQCVGYPHPEGNSGGSENEGPREGASEASAAAVGRYLCVIMPMRI